MEYKELIAAFAAKCGIEGLSASDWAAGSEPSLDETTLPIAMGGFMQQV